MSENMGRTAPKEILIIGGSLAGLMQGIMLQNLGHNVRILEQSPGSSPDSHMAGVCAAADVLTFLHRFESDPRLKEHPLGIPSECLQSIDSQGKISVFLRVPRLMTSWDALYFRLRAEFDGLRSEYFPNPPAAKLRRPLKDDGRQQVCSYETGRRVVSIEDEGSTVQVGCKDVESGKVVNFTADLVIGADGPNSIVRKTFLPAVKRSYAGYIAWRGVVPEEEVSQETRNIFQRNITYFVLKGGGHVIVYNIPGEFGSIDSGKRLLNFCWYTNESPKNLSEIMTDKTGHEHQISISPGQVRSTIWNKQVQLGHKLLSTPYLEIMNKIHKPFIHKITDYYSPQASFAKGKVLLVGDALTLLRPHIAFSTNQAAWNCMMLEKLVKDEIDVGSWEREVTREGYLHWCRSVWFGEWFQAPLYKSVFYGLRYWFVAGERAVRYWGAEKPVV